MSAPFRWDACVVSLALAGCARHEPAPTATPVDVSSRVVDAGVLDANTTALLPAVPNTIEAGVVREIPPMRLSTVVTPPRAESRYPFAEPQLPMPPVHTLDLDATHTLRLDGNVVGTLSAESVKNTSGVEIVHVDADGTVHVRRLPRVVKLLDDTGKLETDEHTTLTIRTDGYMQEGHSDGTERLLPLRFEPAPSGVARRTAMLLPLVLYVLRRDASALEGNPFGVAMSPRISWPRDGLPALSPDGKTVVLPVVRALDQRVWRLVETLFGLTQGDEYAKLFPYSELRFVDAVTGRVRSRRAVGSDAPGRYVPMSPAEDGGRAEMAWYRARAHAVRDNAALTRMLVGYRPMVGLHLPFDAAEDVTEFGAGMFLDERLHPVPMEYAPTLLPLEAEEGDVRVRFAPSTGELSVLAASDGHVRYRVVLPASREERPGVPSECVERRAVVRFAWLLSGQSVFVYLVENFPWHGCFSMRERSDVRVVNLAP